MLFGMFHPPQTKAQKRAANAAQSLREQAVRDMVTELRMLINRLEQARQAQFQLFSSDHNDAGMKMMRAVEAAQETIDRVGRFKEMFPRELADLQIAATNAAGFEALASFELEGRDMMIRVRDEAKAQLVPLEVMAMEARGTTSDVNFAAAHAGIRLSPEFVSPELHLVSGNLDFSACALTSRTRREIGQFYKSISCANGGWLS